MPVEKISHEESLFEGTEKLNASIEQSNDAIKEATTAKSTANQAVSTSQEAVTKAESVQAQFNAVVVEGDSSPAADQARVDAENVLHPTLKARADSDYNKVTAQLAEKATKEEARLKSVKIVNEDLSEETLSAITGQTELNLLSIPQDGSVTPKKLSDKYNVFNSANAVDGRYITGYNTTTKQPNYVTNASQFTYQFDLTSYKKIRLLYPAEPAGGFLFSAWNSNLEWISGDAVVNRTTLNDGSKSYVKTDGSTYYEIDVTKLLSLFPTAKYAIVGYLISDKQNCYINVLNSVKLSSFEWYDNFLENEVSTIKSNPRDIVLPANLKVMSGVKFNIYLENIVQYGDVSDFYRFYSIYPSYFIPRSKKHLEVIPQNVADYTWRITGYERLRFASNITKNVNVQHVSKTSGDGKTKKVMFIGDSMTDQAQYTQFLLDKFNDANELMNVEFVGTRGTSPNLHEGRSGWRAWEYVNSPSQNYGVSLNNPFYNPSTSTFDFSYYMSNNGFSGVDMVFINLGKNDFARSTNNTDADFLNSYNAMINSIRTYDPNIKILLWLTPVRGLFTYISTDYKDIDLHTINLLINEFGNREGEHIYLVPVYLNVHPQNAYITQDLTYKEGGTDTYKYAEDEIHPKLGYDSIADAIYPYIKYVGGLS